MDYDVEGGIRILNVEFTGAKGTPGSTLSWSGLSSGGLGVGDVDQTITDTDDDGRLDAGIDTATGRAASDTIETFTGYTITHEDLEYGIFERAGSNEPLVYWVKLPVDGSSGQSIVPGFGTSNAFQSETGTNVFLCYLAGTLIATPDGETPVEALREGDLVLTRDGREVPVKFNLRQTIATLFGSAERLRPVRIAAGALGGGVPKRNLTLTADHALYFDGLLINAGALVNGTTITRVPLSEFGARYTVYHIETEAHDLIVAEGAAAETFIDYAARRSFDNYEEYVARYGEDGTIVERDAPRVTRASQVPPQLRERLASLAQSAA